jgi:CysZ protein
MGSLVKFLFKAFFDILKPRVLSVIFLPFVGSFLLWGTVTYLSWDWIINLGFKFYHIGIMQRLVAMLSPYFVLTQNPLTFVTAAVFILVVIIPAAVVTALLITSVVLVPIIVDELRKTDFPKILKISNSMFTGTGTSISYSMKYFFSWIASLPFWVAIPFGAIVIPFLLLSWFNSRLFTWEIMTEFATKNQIKIFVKENSKPLFVLGLMTSCLYYVPFLNLIAPVISSAAFARFCLSRFKSDPSKNGSDLQLT